MQDGDITKFFEIWDRVAQMKRKTPDDGVTKKGYFRMLSRYSLEEIANALEAHMMNPDHGHYLPGPSDVVREFQLHSPNQFPGPEEAWSSFPRDESLSVCVCSEMLTAWGVALDLDPVAGRMAFKESYKTHVSRAQAQGKKPIWFISPGSDKQHLEQTALEAVRSGRIEAEAGAVYLPHIPVTDLKQLADGQVTANALQLAHDQTVSAVDQLLIDAPLASEETRQLHLKKIRELT